MVQPGIEQPVVAAFHRWLHPRLPARAIHASGNTGLARGLLSLQAAKPVTRNRALPSLYHTDNDD